MGRGRALAALVFLTLLWGYNWVIAKQALSYAGPFTFACLRALGGSAALLVALPLLGRPLRLVAPLKTAVIGLVQTGGFLFLSTWALVEGGAGKTAVLTFTMPIWTLLLGRLLLGERVRGAQWLAVAGAFLGLLLILAPWDMAGTPTAKVLAVAGAVAWAMGTVLIKRWRRDLAVDVLSFTAWQMAIGSVALIPVALAVPERPVDWVPAFWGILAFIAVIGTALGWFLWLHVLEHLPAWQASLSVLGIPVVAILSSRWSLAEPVEPLELAGMLLVGAGLGLMSLLNWRSQRRTSPRVP
ncbi:MAG TPA: EamA family transporter [Rhodocyclaceae bacterium]|nr:EamA family transporter [Rhodocyclaceae bacterium]